MNLFIRYKKEKDNPEIRENIQCEPAEWINYWIMMFRIVEGGVVYFGNKLSSKKKHY